MRNIFSVFIGFCFSLNVFAQSGSLPQLETAFNDHQYVMTVEWDQKDEVFEREQTEKFIQQIKAILSNGNVTKEELEKFVTSKVGSSTSESLKLKLSLVQLNNEAELAAFLASNSKDFYSKGASWNGRAVQGLATLGAIAVILGVIMIITTEKTCNGGKYYAPVYECRIVGEDTVCKEWTDCV